MIEKSFINNELGVKFNSYIDCKCKIWFKAKEVATILKYKNTDDAIKRHVSENHKRKLLLSQQRDSRGQVVKDKKSCPRETRGQGQKAGVDVSPPQQNVTWGPETGRQQNDTKVKCSPRETRGQQNDTRGKYCIFIDEAGFYELVFKSKLETAKIFREWVFTKVLPSIRKYGYYKMIDSRIKQRVIIDGVKYYRHSVFINYAASKNGEVINVKTGRIMNIKKRGNNYLRFTISDTKLEKPFTYYQHRFVYEVFKGAIPKCLEIDHINNIKSDNRIKNLQLLTPRRNNEKSKNRPIISTNIETGKERRYISIKKASIELDISSGNISQVCRKKFKLLTSKKDGKKYTFKYLD